MRWIVRMIAMVSFLAVTALILAGLPHVSERFWDQETNRITQDDDIYLTQSNLVDYFIQLDFDLPLQRVEWSGDSLIVDFQLTSIAQREQLYSDLYRLSEFAFTETHNVNRLLVKVNAYLEGENRMLITLDAGRSQWKENQNMEQWLNDVLTYQG